MTAEEAIVRLAGAVPPAGGVAVMATGIVSVGLTLDHRPTLSRILLGLGVALWLGLSAIFASRGIWQRRRWLEDAREPGALTLVAGTGVLGARLTLLGEDRVGYLLLALAISVWLALLGPILRHWRTHRPWASPAF